MVVGALPLAMGGFPKYEIALLGAPDWPGPVQGFNVSLLDLIILSIYLILPRSRTTLPFKYPFFLYIFVTFLSAFYAPTPMAALYYGWQLLRMFLVYAVVARLCEDPRHTVYILRGLALGLCVQAGFVLWQRFVVHYLHVTGTYSHQNALGFVTHFVVFPFFALLLAGQKKWEFAAVPILGIAIDILTASRASLGLAGAGLSILLLFSISRRMTARKTQIIAVGIFVLALLSPLAYRQYELRYGAAGETFQLEAGGGRTELNNAAALILSESPLGIGANNFVMVANVRGYYERADVGITNRKTSPHSLYWTTAAEMGYSGLIALIVFLLRPLLVAFSCAWRNRNDPRGDLLLGLGMSLVIVYVHCFLEWIFLSDLIQYAFIINVGIIAGVARQLGYWSKAGVLPKPSLQRS